MWSGFFLQFADTVRSQEEEKKNFATEQLSHEACFAGETLNCAVKASLLPNC